MSKNECLATDFFQQPLFWFEIFSGNSLHLYLQPTLKVLDLDQKKSKYMHFSNFSFCVF